MTSSMDDPREDRPRLSTQAVTIYSSGNILMGISKSSFVYDEQEVSIAGLSHCAPFKED